MVDGVETYVAKLGRRPKRKNGGLKQRVLVEQKAPATRVTNSWGRLIDGSTRRSRRRRASLRTTRRSRRRRASLRTTAELVGRWDPCVLRRGRPVGVSRHELGCWDSTAGGQAAQGEAFVPTELGTPRYPPTHPGHSGSVANPHEACATGVVSEPRGSPQVAVQGKWAGVGTISRCPERTGIQASLLQRSRPQGCRSSTKQGDPRNQTRVRQWGIRVHYRWSSVGGGRLWAGRQARGVFRSRQRQRPRQRPMNPYEAHPPGVIPVARNRLGDSWSILGGTSVG